MIMIIRSINLSTKRSLFLFGARATGKTTLLKNKFKPENAFFINLLDRSLLAKLQSYPNELEPMILPSIEQGKLIIIDEVQRIPELLDIVHKLIQEKKALFILTGSSARKLKRGSANMLAGRASVYRLYPLLFSELKENFSLEEALSWGTLPELSLMDDDEEKYRFLDAYGETYVQEEIVAEQIIRNLPPFRRFLQVASQMNSKVINASKIAADINTNPSNVRNYFEIIEDTLLGFKLNAYHSSIRKRQRQNPKFYWFDTGLIRSLQKRLFLPLEPSTSYYGELFETFIVNQIKTTLEYKGKPFDLSYLLTKDGAEIDLIIERAGHKTICLEIKSSQSIRKESLNNLRTLSADIQNSEAICIYNGTQELRYDKIKVIPWKEFFNYL